MKIDYLCCRIVRSGGTKIIAQHVKLLQERGHDARILTPDQEGVDLWGVPVVRVKAFDQNLLGKSDILVGSWLRDVETAARIRGPVICHLCQGYEPIEFSFRINEEAIPLKYRYRGTWSRLLFLRKKWSFQRRIRRTEQVYRLPTVKMAVSQALKEVIEKTHGGHCYCVPNGVDLQVFRPSSRPKSFESTLRLVSIGPIGMVFKGIFDTFDAVRLLKEKGVPVEFIRVSLSSPPDAEVKSGLVDRFLTGLNEGQMAELYQTSHILIAPSLWEGFGLPVIEAMSSHVPCILANSGSYRSLSNTMDFAYFVPPHSPETIAEGVLKIKEDGAFRERIIKRGIEVARQYSLENMGDTLEETLLKVVRGHKGSVIKDIL